jgi:hypothetical protein
MENATPNQATGPMYRDLGEGAQAREQAGPHQALDEISLHAGQSIRSATGAPDRRTSALETRADDLDDVLLGVLVLPRSGRQQPEDPARQDLLDRTVESQGRELG